MRPAPPIHDREIVDAVLRISDQLGPREWVRGLDYFRCMEYPLVLEALKPERGQRLLDMGCGSGPFALFLAHQIDISVDALDIDPKSVAWQNRGARKLGLEPSRFSATVGDSRSLPHADESFDLVLNLGSIEHIPDDGDTVAAREMTRVLKTGGRSVLSVPYGPRHMQIDSGPHVSGFERRYNDRALEERLIDPSRMVETSRTYFGEPTSAVSSIWYRTPLLVKLPIRRLAPFFARRWLARFHPDDRGRACGACLVLQKSG